MTGVSIVPEVEGGPGPRPVGGEFRPDLEGLRAVAVMLVLAYHVGLPLFGGGYTGVDVFFVLSGFLITGLIVRELQATGSVSLATFYARRARRLLPAAALVLVLTVLAAWAILPALVVGDVGGDAAAAALYVSNIRFAWQATDYFTAAAAPSPLLHYWSLGVEEQFYLVWPALLLATTARARWSIRRVAVVVAVIGCGSFAASLVLTGSATPWAFYSLPTRAWELALGAGVALMGIRGFALPRAAAVVTAAAGLAAVVGAGLALDTSTPFPGTAALLPTIGAALVITAGLRGPVGPVARGLSAAPVRWLGRISYSLYLWHWPVLVIPVAAAGGELPLRVRVLLGLVAIVLAAATHRWVEEPLRAGRLIGRRPRHNLALAGALTLAVALSSVGIGQAATGALSATDRPGVEPGVEGVLGKPPPPDHTLSAPTTGSATGSATAVSSPAAVGPHPVPVNLEPPLAGARDDRPIIYVDGCNVGYSDTTSPRCEYGDPDSSTTVVLFGDSHAAQWFPAIHKVATGRGWRLLSLTKPNCAVVDAATWVERLKREYTECAAWREAALQRFAADRPDLVIVVNSKSGRLLVDGAPDPAGQGAAWDKALARLLGRVATSVGEVVLISDTPSHAVDPPVCLSEHLDDAHACATPREMAVSDERIAADRRVASSAGTAYVDPTGWVCPSDPCPLIIGNVLTHHDRGHITATFSIALAPYLAAALPPIDQPSPSESGEARQDR